MFHNLHRRITDENLIEIHGEMDELLDKQACIHIFSGCYGNPLKFEMEEGEEEEEKKMTHA